MAQSVAVLRRVETCGLSAGMQSRRFNVLFYDCLGDPMAYVMPSLARLNTHPYSDHTSDTTEWVRSLPQRVRKVTPLNILR